MMKTCRHEVPPTKPSQEMLRLDNRISNFARTTLFKRLIACRVSQLRAAVIVRSFPDNLVSRRGVLARIAAASAIFASLDSKPAKAITTRINGVRSVEQYFRALSQAHRLNRAAIVDIAAEWCDYCRVIDDRIMRAPRVLELLQEFAVIRVDVTETNDATRSLLQTLNAWGPPTIFIVDTETGREFSSTRSVGPFDPDNLVARMQSVKGLLLRQRSPSIAR